MPSATERLPVLMTKEQKARIAEKARAANLTMGEFVRRAVDAYEPAADDEMIEGLIEQVLRTTAQATHAMEETLAFVSASRQRIERLESEHAAREAA
jgi:mobilization protein NikA